MVLDGQRMGDERDWVLVGFFVTCSSSAEKRFIRPAKQDEMGLWQEEQVAISSQSGKDCLELYPRLEPIPLSISLQLQIEKQR